MSLTFDNLSSAAGLQQLNDYLLGRTFVFGINASKADLDLIALVKSCPDASKYPAAARWWNYISSFDDAAKKSFKAYGLTVGLKSAGGAPKATKEDDESDDDDLFGDDDDEEEEDEEELAKLAAKKKDKKLAPVLRSQICFDIKPMDTEVDLEEMADEIKELVIGEIDEYAVRVKEFNDFRVTADKICVWGVGHQVVPIAFGIEKLQISCVVIDEMMGVDDVKDVLEAKFGDKIQSVDVLAFNKAEALKVPKEKK
eukprot:g4491.t1